MHFSWLKFAFVTAVLSATVLGQNAPGVSGQGTRAKESAVVRKRAKAKAGKKNTKVAKAPEPEPQPPAVVVPPTPEQLPATPPQVSYLNGQLTIQATNSTLSSILNAIRQQTGAEIELPAGTGNERVATRVGPGPAQEVVAALLSGSSFDYVILGSQTSPGGLERLILTPKGRAAAPTVNLAHENPAPAPNDENGEETDTSETSEPPPEAPETSEQPVMQAPPQQLTGQPEDQQQEASQPPPPAAAQPEAAPTEAPSPDQAPPSNAEQASPGQPQVKTPEQFVQELQRMQQQQDQQQKAQQQQQQQQQQPKQ